MHNHKDIIQQLKADKEEIKAMTKQPSRIESTPAVVLTEEPEFDLDAELEAVEVSLQEEAMAAVEAAPEVKPLTLEEKVKNHAKEALAKRADAPSAAQIEEWRQKYGKEGVQVTVFDDDNIFIYTYVTLVQWDKIQKLAEQKQKAGADYDRAMREAVMMTGVLWPKITPQYFLGEKTRGGILQTVSELIMLNSYFMPATSTINLTTSL